MALPSHTATVVSPPADIEALAAHYTLRNAGPIRAFLDRHPSLIPLLLEFPAQAQSLFGPDAPLSLLLCSNPEYPQETTLAAFIGADIATDAAFEEAEGKLRRLQDGWWRRVHHQAEDRLCIDVEQRHGV